MPEKIYCILCKEILISDQEKELGTHFYCSAEFAKKNVNNLFVPETSINDVSSQYQAYTDTEVISSHNSLFALVSFNILVISLFSLIIFFVS